MEELVLNARRREDRGKGRSRRLRGQGEMPAVMYGEGENLSLVVSIRDLRQLLNTQAGANVLMRLCLQGEEDVERVVMVRELQSDPVRGGFLHADLMRISMDREVEVEVPIELEGTAVGVAQDNGHLGQLLWNLAVRCLPDRIPASIQADVSGLALGEVLHVGDLQLPEGVTVLTDPEEGVANVTMVAVEVEAPVEEEAEAVPAEGEAVEAEEEPEGAKEEPAEG